eukprot:COSAG01_NODE_4305_length_5154_cov_19.526795_2_plen_205_part_00
MALPEERLEQLEAAIDRDGDGRIDLGEFFRQFGDGHVGAEGTFVRSAGWAGVKAGYVFRSGSEGVGYYLDVGLENRILLEGKRDNPDWASPVQKGAARQRRERRAEALASGRQGDAVAAAAACAGSDEPPPRHRIIEPGACGTGAVVEGAARQAGRAAEQPQARSSGAAGRSVCCRIARWCACSLPLSLSPPSLSVLALIRRCI